MKAVDQIIGKFHESYGKVDAETFADLGRRETSEEDADLFLPATNAVGGKVAEFVKSAGTVLGFGMLASGATANILEEEGDEALIQAVEEEAEAVIVQIFQYAGFPEEVIPDRVKAELTEIFNAGWTGGADEAIALIKRLDEANG